MYTCPKYINTCCTEKDQLKEIAGYFVFFLVQNLNNKILRQRPHIRWSTHDHNHQPVCKANQFSLVIDHFNVIANANPNIVVMSVENWLKIHIEMGPKHLLHYCLPSMKVHYIGYN